MRLKPNRITLTLVLLFPLLLHAQVPLPKTLLWRIAPPDGGKPSWLCGTIHVQDRRVFHFTDSLYDALARADAFAMELDPDTLVQAIFAQLNGQKEKSVKTLKDQMDAKTWNEVRPKLKKLSGKNPDQMTVEEAKAFYRKRRQPKAQDDDMPTILDLYLSNIAKDMGKPVTGLEKFADQSSLVDDLEEPFDPAKLTGGKGSSFEPAMDKMIRVYADGDLQSVYDLTTTFDPVEMDKLLVQRNRKMAAHMDSLATDKSYFFAVGAAHLPGKDGLIEAMRLRGYTVDPVLSDRKMEPGHYVFKHREEWRSYSDPYEGWSISLPGKPFPINTGKGLDMTGYMDLSDMRIYFLMGIAMGEDQDLLSRDTGFINRLRNVYNKGSEMHIDTAYRVIDTDTLRAWDMVGTENASDFHVRIRIVFHGGRMFMVCIGTKHAAEIHDARSEKYLSSFRPLPAIKGFRMFSDTTMGFTVLMPGLTKKDLSQQDSTISAWHYTCGTTVDGMAANVIVVTAGPNYVITSDSSYFRKSAQNIVDGEMKLVRQADTVVNGQNAMMLEFLSGHDEFINHMLSVKRGGRIFTLLATEDVAKPSPEARERYFSSLRLLEPGGAGWSQRLVPGTNLNVWGPSEWTLRPPEEETPHSAVYLGYDERSSVSYNIYLDTLSRYMWSTDDHALLDHYLSSYHFPGQDELSRRYFHTDNGARCMEMTTKVEDSRQVKRVQVCLQGDRLLTTTAYVPGEWEHDRSVDAFFTSARPPASGDSMALRDRGAFLLFNDLHSTDPDLRDTAYNALDGLYFPPYIFPSVLGEVLVKGFPEDSTNGSRIEAKLMSCLADMADSTSPAYIHIYWPLIRKDKEHLRYDLLNIVTGLKTKNAFSMVPGFLQEHLPREPDAYLTITDLLDTLSLAHGIWKDLLPFSGDSVLGPELFRLHKALLDSGYINIEDLRRSFPLMQGALLSFDKQLVSDKYAPFRSSGKAIFNLLGKLNDASSRTWLRKYLGSPSSGGRLYAAVELIKQGQAIDAGLWATIAKDKETRLDLYDELKALDKLKLFPKEYLVRKSFAESHAWLLAEDDYEPKSIHFLREVTTDFNGASRTFFLYRVSVEDDDGDYAQLVIVGPYKPGTRDLLPPEEDDVSGVYEDDEYAPGLELRHLASYLKGLEKSR